MGFKPETQRTTTDYTALVGENNGTVYGDDKLQLAFLSTGDYFDKDYLNYNFYALEKKLAGLYDNRASANASIIDHDKDTNIKLLLLDLIYPIGSIYMSEKNNSPANFLGGTWVQIKDSFLLSKGDKTLPSGNSTGQVTLTTINLPSHTHSVAIGSHTHTFTGSAHNHGPTGGTHFIVNDGANLYLQEDLREYPAKNAKGHRYMVSDCGTGSHGIAERTKTANATQGGTVASTDLGTKTSGSAGSGAAFSIMPPYTAVYMWKRTG